MDELLTPTQVAAMLTNELDWRQASTRSNIYDGTLLGEPWRLQRTEQTTGLKTDWRIRSDSVRDLIRRYKSPEWDRQELPHRKTNAERQAATSDTATGQDLIAIAEDGPKIADLVRTLTKDHRRVHASYSETLRVIGEALIALSTAVEGK